MSIYAADQAVIARVAEIAWTVRTSLGQDPETDAESLDAAIEILDDVYAIELAVWSDPRTEVPRDELAAATVELAATWVCLARFRFVALGLVLAQTVEESWPDKVPAWREHGYEVSKTMGDASGDYAAAADYLRHYTQELLGEGPH